MTEDEGRLAGAGGVEVFVRSWRPDSEPRAAAVLVHGAGEHSGRYPHVAARLVAEGFAVHALDHRGHGRSGGDRALIDRLEHAVADIDALVDRVLEREARRPLYMIGHSMGGTLALSYAIAHQDRLSGLVLSAPLAAIEAPAALRLVGRMLSRVAPRAGLLAVDPGLVSRDPAVVEAYVSDPLVHHGKLPARTLAELTETIDSFPQSVAAIKLPALILYGTADGLCPPAGSVMVAERLGSSEVTVKSYDGLYHEVFNEPEQDVVLGDLCAWLNDQLARASAQSSSLQPLR